MPQLTMWSPIGDLTLTEEGGALVSLDWGRGRDQAKTPLLVRALTQLKKYFDGTDFIFELPLNPAGTSKQKKVWSEMIKIPAGTTCPYGAIASKLGTSARAVGTACSRNPIPIIIPCHRVINGEGSLGAFSGDGGAKTKAVLLSLEGNTDYPPDLFGEV